ncbi:MAG: beta-glucosidase [Roseburia sp.]|jgi:beta-glucosidase-like glycosyl hydrolase|nr:beta-glucosidase [Roseburia sp.]
MREKTVYPDYFTRADYRKDSPEVTERTIDALIAAMTIEEKLSLLGGGKEPDCKGKIGNAGYQPGVPRLGIPEAVMYDGPAGVTGIVETTGLPQPSLLGCTWDDEMAYDFGRAAASENAACSGNYQLAPQVDTVHTPHFGRNKDMKSEDSYLVSRMSVAETKGTQDQNVIATVKHYAVANTPASPAGGIDNRVDEQTLHETYLRPFEACIREGGTGSVMTSYNKVNGTYSSDSRDLNITILRNQWGFRGSLMSDWGSVHTFTLSQGTDIEMPHPAYNDTSRVMKHIRRGDLTWDDIDRAVRHVLWGMASVGLLGLVRLDENGSVMEEPGRTLPIQMEWRYEEEVKNGLFDRNTDISRQILKEGIVLLKNNGALPLTESSGKVALIGLGAKYPVCGQMQERSYGRLSAMLSGAEAYELETGTHVTPYPGIDFAGEPIPAECLFLDADCTTNGVDRLYGIRSEDRSLGASAKGPGGMGAAFMGMDAFDEDGERVSAMVGSWEERDDSGFSPEQIGTHCATDPCICFTTGTKTYQNPKEGGGNAFPTGSYTWKSFLRAPETGEYRLKLHCIGGNARFLIQIDGEWQEVAESRTRENTQWPWDTVICTPTGMGINSAVFHLTAGTVYPILIYAEHTVIGKDLQVAAAWSLPSFLKRNYDEALAAAAEADTILFYAVNSGENETMFSSFANGPSPKIELAEEQTQLLSRVADAKKPDARLIVILQTSSTLAIGSWADRADAIITAYQGGQEGSRMVMQAVTGKINPSGKLAQTWPRRSEDTPVTDTPEHFAERYSGILLDGEKRTHLTEGIFFGYRWYDRYDIEPLYPFGYGLSYTTYRYDNLSVAPDGATFIVSLDVTNTGSCAGDEIVQVYLGKAEVPPYVQMAEKQLAGYLRVKDLAPGETRRITIPIDERSLYYWDIAYPLQNRPDGTKDKWHRAVGTRQILVGASSRDIRLAKEVHVDDVGGRSI